MEASRESSIVFQKELAIITVDWLADKDGIWGLENWILS